MNAQFERNNKPSDEWYTPRWILDKLGEFDLDPCAPINRLWDTAKVHLTQQDDGLKHDWSGARVWLNPPYSRPLVDRFITRMAENNNGIALLFNRCDTAMFQDVIFPTASAMLFIRGRVAFHQPSGTLKGRPGNGSVLIAFGHHNADILEQSNIPGRFIKLPNH